MSRPSRPPYAAIGFILVCTFLFALYAGLSPIRQQAMVEVAGMQPGGALANVIVALRLPALNAPIIGASGAVSAVVGAYLGLFPRRRIGLYLPLGLYLQFARVPAVIVIGSWFTLQLLYTAFGPINATVAWLTHMTGFAL